MVSGMKQVHRSREFWAGLIWELEQSLEPRTEFARRHRVNLSTLKVWQWRLRKEGRTADRDDEVRLLPVKVRTDVQVASGGSVLLEASVGDVVVRFSSSVSPTYMAELLSRVARAARC
jgi:hypothetical protein